MAGTRSKAGRNHSIITFQMGQRQHLSNVGCFAIIQALSSCEVQVQGYSDRSGICQPTCRAFAWAKMYWTTASVCLSVLHQSLLALSISRIRFSWPIRFVQIPCLLSRNRAIHASHPSRTQSYILHSPYGWRRAYNALHSIMMFPEKITWFATAIIQIWM